MDGNTSVMTIALGLYVGMTLSQFFTAITRDLVTPLIAGVFPGAKASLDKVIIEIGTIKLNIGDAIAATMNLAIAWLVVSLTLPYIRTYAPIGGRR